MTAPTTSPTLLLELEDEVPELEDPEPEPDVEDDAGEAEVVEECGVEATKVSGSEL